MAVEKSAQPSASIIIKYDKVALSYPTVLT